MNIDNLNYIYANVWVPYFYFMFEIISYSSCFVHNILVSIKMIWVFKHFFVDLHNGLLKEFHLWKP